MNLSQRFSQARAVLGIMHGSRVFGGPVQANLSITNRCNIRCIHCYYYSPFLECPTFQPLRRARLTGKEPPDSGPLKRLQTMDADTNGVRSLMRELIRMGTRRYQFGGGGEVFLHKNVLEFMGYLKRAGSYCTVNSNGTLIDRAVSDELIKMGYDELRITTMAGSPEMYARTHPGIASDMFDRLSKNLLYLAERKTALGLKRPKITLVFIVVAQNFEGILEFAEFAARMGVNSVQYRPVDDVEDSGLANLVPNEEQAASAREQIVEAKSYLESKGISHNIGNFQNVFHQQLDTTAFYRFLPCYYGWLAVMINTNGEVYPCCRCYEPLGNVYQKKFSEIWNGHAYRAFRKEAFHVNKRKTAASDCDCNSCVHHAANLRVYKLLNPMRRYSARVKQLSSNVYAEEE